MRIGILALFLGVFGMVFVPMCIGIPMVGGSAAWTMAEFAPTRQDMEDAERLRERAREEGVELEVSAVEIAMARRAGELENLDEAADAYFEARGNRSFDEDDGPTTPPAPVHYSGAYYPEEPEEEAFDVTPWLWAGGAFAGIFAALIGVVVAFQSLTGSDEETAGPPLT
ncbi:MAG: hypothetical protein H6737_14765 [Alphaproteobacteria bacterium]|nr:hypothetical protein [Alphaproteobacteria bacterium]